MTTARGGPAAAKRAKPKPEPPQRFPTVGSLLDAHGMREVIQAARDASTAYPAAPAPDWAIGNKRFLEEVDRSNAAVRADYCAQHDKARQEIVLAPWPVCGFRPLRLGEAGRLGTWAPAPAPVDQFAGLAHRGGPVNTASPATPEAGEEAAGAGEPGEGHQAPAAQDTPEET